MNFNDRVINFDKTMAPNGWKLELSVEEYDRLDRDRKRYYGPLYVKYRTKRIRDYDFETGDFIGWKPIQVGIGEPVAYEYIGYLAARTIDNLLASNVFASRILGKSRPGNWR